jgi:hypothetical protein
MRRLGEGARRALGAASFLVSLAAGHRRKRAASEPSPNAPSPLAVVLREWALQDLVILAYLVVMLLAVFHGGGPRRPAALGFLLVDIVVFATLVTAARRSWFGPTAGAVLYRCALLFGLLASFFQLQWLLPSARGATVDAELYAFDRTVFGIEPAEALDRFVTPATTEWFAFFYFGYFPLLAAYVLPSVLAARGRRELAELSFGIVWVFCVAHLTYLVVPGFGPYVHLADHFGHRLEGGTFWPLVTATVESVDSGSRTDIFPSLHTAAPTFLAVYAFRRRREEPFRTVWAPTVFAVSQIVLATMFLRWHYLVDVCAGLAHGASTAFIASAVARWEESWRVRTGRQPVWTTPWREPDRQPEEITVSATLVRPSFASRSPAQAPEPRSSSRQTAGRRS